VLKPTLKPLLQPDQTGMCGQTCVAMAAGVSIEEASSAIGMSVLGSHGTEASDLARGLRKLGMAVGEAGPFPKTHRVPRFAIVAIDDNKTSWGHWVLLHEGFVYDPGIGWPLPVHVYEEFIVRGAYSRRYRRARDAGKRVKAKWGTYLPIYGWRKK
jgi:hypothetical protein